MAKKNSNMRLRIEGADQVIKALRRGDEEIQKKVNDLVSEAAEIVFREADKHAPIGPTGRTRTSLEIKTGTNNKGIFYANVVVGAKKGEKTATSAFYVTFYEYGTSRQPARPFMRPAMNRKKAEVRRHITTGLQSVIRQVGRG